MGREFAGGGGGVGGGGGGGGRGEAGGTGGARGGKVQASTPLELKIRKSEGANGGWGQVSGDPSGKLQP